MSRQNNSLIYLLDPKDEPLVEEDPMPIMRVKEDKDENGKTIRSYLEEEGDDRGCYYIHILSFNKAAEEREGAALKQHLVNNFKFAKLRDWTGLTKDFNYRENMNFALDKNNILYACYSFD